MQLNTKIEYLEIWKVAAVHTDYFSYSIKAKREALVGAMLLRYISPYSSIPSYLSSFFCRQKGDYRITFLCCNLVLCTLTEIGTVIHYSYHYDDLFVLF